MSEIINVQSVDGQLLVSSREIATNFEKRHNDVVKVIENLTTENFVVKEMFKESTFEHKGNFYKEYLINRDGFSLLVMGFTGSRAMSWKLKYINIFNKMEQQLRNPYANISPELQAIFTIDKKQQEMEVKVEKLYNTMTIDYAQQEELRMLANRTVVEILGGKDTISYKKLKHRVFQDLWRSYKKHLRVNSYKNTATKDYDSGINFIENFKVDEVLNYAIQGLNSQLAFA